MAWGQQFCAKSPELVASNRLPYRQAMRAYLAIVRNRCRDLLLRTPSQVDVQYRTICETLIIARSETLRFRFTEAHFRVKAAMVRLRQKVRSRTGELYGVEIGAAAGPPSGTVHPILARLETVGWLTSRWEEIDPRAEGRPARRYYHLTPRRRRAVPGRPGPGLPGFGRARLARTAGSACATPKAAGTASAAGSERRWPIPYQRETSRPIDRPMPTVTTRHPPGAAGRRPRHHRRRAPHHRRDDGQGLRGPRSRGQPDCSRTRSRQPAAPGPRSCAPGTRWRTVPSARRPGSCSPSTAHCHCSR